ncbi:MAG: hypothetical protein V1774_05765 [Candidatus Eisenbacteria bacterium]
MEAQRPLVLYGMGIQARTMAREIDAAGSHRVVGFTVDRPYLTADRYAGLPVVAFDAVEGAFPPRDYELLVLVGYRRMRRRREAFIAAKAKGYHMPNIVSPGARLAQDIVLGENNLIGDLVCCGPAVRIGDNNVIRPMVHIGHDTAIGSHNFIAPCSAMAGTCAVGDLCYVGIGAVMIDRVALGDETLLSAGAVVTASTPACSQFSGNPARKIGEHPGTGILFLG